MALGVNVSTRDHIYGWEVIPARTRSPKEIAYREAADKADKMWKEYCHKADVLLAQGKYAEINAEGEKCIEADRVASRLYKAWMEV